MPTENARDRRIAYRCPECGTTTFGLVGRFALTASMLRLKCDCEKRSNLDISITNDDKIKLSVPCLYCKDNHNYTVTKAIFFERDIFNLSCPYSSMDIAFIGDTDRIGRELERTGKELDELLKNLEVEDIDEIQPQNMNDDEILPDPAVYDTIRFIVKDLEDEGKIDCPCHKGEYELRYTDTGIQVYCTECGATYDFNAPTPAMSEEYLGIDAITLK